MLWICLDKIFDKSYKKVSKELYVSKSGSKVEVKRFEVITIWWSTSKALSIRAVSLNALNLEYLFSRITSFAKFGRSGYQLIIDQIEFSGEGSILKLIEDRRKKFEQLGYFDINIKLPIPKYPETIAIITSPTGSVVRDIIQRVNSRYPLIKLLICPITVQGKSSHLEIIEYLNNTNRPYSDKEIYDNMHKPMPYAKFRVLLDKIHQEGKIGHRTNGKFKLYWPQQNQFETLSKEAMDALDVEIVEKRELERELNKGLKTANFTISNLRNQQTLDELKTNLKKVKEEHEMKTKKLNEIKSNSAEIDPEEREKLKKEGIFPGCLGCCQSEYIGSTPVAGEAVTERRIKRVEFLKVKESGCSAQAFHDEKSTV